MTAGARPGSEGEKRDLDALLGGIAFCRFLGIVAERRDGELALVLPFAQHLVGNPILPAIHGGVIGALLETTAIAQLVFELGGTKLPKPVDINIDFLRSGRPVDTFARARITKLGRRVVNVHAEAWQDTNAKPIAALRGHFLVSSEANAPA